MLTKSPSLQAHKDKLDRARRSSSPIQPGSRDVSQVVVLAADNSSYRLPRELDSYLITTSKPHEVFAVLQQSRDRRLRLLLRRFTNQIQYGCKNPYCDVSTCLSYRKRHAKTPVRPYTDIAARAFAWRCIEEFADTGKEYSQTGGNTTRRNGKNEALAYSGAPGLCQNEPVVPWYEDPSQAGRRIKNTAQRSGSEHAIRGYTRAASTSTSRIPQSDTQGNNVGTDPASVKSESHNTEVRALESDDRPRTPISGDARAVQIGQSNGSDRDNGLSPAPDSSSAVEDRRVHFVDPFEDTTRRKQQAPKDRASFTQILYDTLAVKKLDVIPTRHGLLENVSQTNSDNDSNAIFTEASASERIESDFSYLKDTGETQVRAVSTFKVLPLSAVLWLRSIMPYDAQSSPPRDLSTTMDYGKFSILVRQSLHFCLSRPGILLQSAKTWTFVHTQPHKLGEKQRLQTLKKLVSQEKLMLPMSKASELPQPGGIMVALGMMVAMTSIPEVLGHLFAALQHAYVLPPGLNRPRNVEALTSKARHAARVPPSGLHGQSHSDESSQAKATSSQGKPYGAIYVEDDEVVRLCMLVILALQLVLALKHQPTVSAGASPGKDFNERYWTGRNSGSMFPFADLVKAWSGNLSARPNYQAYTTRIDTMDDWHFQRILDSVMDVFSHRIAISNMKRSSKITGLESEKPTNVVDMFIEELLRALKFPDPVVHKTSFSRNFLDLLRSVILRRWDRQAIIQRCGPVGGTLEILAALYRRRDDFGIPASDFQWTFVTKAFDEFEMPVKWLDFRADNIQTHILCYSFLFEPASLVTYFRAINSSIMVKSHEAASFVFADAQKFLRNDHKMPITVYGVEEVLAGMRPNMAPYFVLTIRRSDMLRGAINQIWRRQRQELMRPLKVRLGKDEGEDGLDHGGVQAEFFRMLFAEALDPSYGMFTVDDRTRMIWFQPGSLEPLYKFEALGILTSLAVYNGVTLPLTFPVAFYRKLLDLKVRTVSHISDGWPALAKGLQYLLDYTDGDVGDVISRTYEFVYEAFGTSYAVDISRIGRDDPWPLVERRKSKEKLKTTFEFPNNLSPTPPLEDDSASEPVEGSDYHGPKSPTSFVGTGTPLSLPSSSAASPKMKALASDIEAPLVTNANREQYVRDYIYWLTDKSVAPQSAAFASGFYTCLDRTALSIFTPEHLKSVIEGHQTIDIDELQATTTYDDYRPTDEVIQWFWQIVRDMSPDQHKKLLEFVTASDRVPVNGFNSVVFIIQRNGPGDEKLPQSSTCYGRLLLPGYSTKEILRTKLEKAIENSIGFGSL